MQFNSGDYTCLELLIQSAYNRDGFARLGRPGEPGIRQEPAGKGYHAWARLPLRKHSEYILDLQDADAALCYLSGNADIMETGIRFLDSAAPTGGYDRDSLQALMDTPIREQYHFTPFRNWLNDPNGLCWYRGRYHMFYQYNPCGQQWDNMYWGHAVSTDLVHWIYLPLVLEPQEEVLKNPGLKGGAFSGCALPLDDRVVFFFTRDIGLRSHRMRKFEDQMIMESRDMLHFSPEKTLITSRPDPLVTADFRDPKVTRIGDTYYMVLGSCLGHRPAVLLYESADLEKWNYRGPLLVDDTPGVSAFECPDFFELDGRFVLTVSLMDHVDANGRRNGVRYYVGDFRDGRLITERSGLVDFGTNFYALQSFARAGRRIAIGWIADPYHEHRLVPGGAYGSMSLPRELHVRHDLLIMEPVPELDALGDVSSICSVETAANGAVIPGNSYRVRIVLRKPTDFHITLGRNADGTSIALRRAGGVTELRTKGVPSETVRFPADVDEVRRLDIFVDRRVVEVFINGGEAAGTRLFYSETTDGFFQAVFSQQEAVGRLEISPMQSIWKSEGSF